MSLSKRPTMYKSMAVSTNTKLNSSKQRLSLKVLKRLKLKLSMKSNMNKTKLKFLLKSNMNKTTLKRKIKKITPKSLLK